MNIKNIEFYTSDIRITPHTGRAILVGVFDVDLSDIIGAIEISTSAEHILDCISDTNIWNYIESKGWKIIEGPEDG